jgi:WD40 repeat protein/beta-lactamase regulating signal transducer with metallopeptidase domain
MVTPVMLPLPAWLSQIGEAARQADPGNTIPSPPPIADPASFTIVSAQPAVETAQNPDGSTKQASDSALSPMKAEPIVITLAFSPQDAAPSEVSEAPAGPSWSLSGALAGVWALGVLVCLVRALVRLALLYRCAWRARPIHDNEWIDSAASLASGLGLKPAELRECPTIAAPLTLGFFRPLILLPLGRSNWSPGERVLILRHELAHIRRHDFLAGLAAELAMCLCWFHPLVRWLVCRLRLEQEYAADAWAASATTDRAEYVRCLARLALELSQARGSLAPAFWRRRPEILRRIDMLRCNPKGFAPCLGRRSAGTVAVMASLVCLAIAGVGPLRSAADESKAGVADPQANGKATADAHGDPLPAGALARLGTTRLRHGAEISFVAFGADGKTLLTASQDNTIRLWDLETGKEIRRFARPKPSNSKGNKGKAEEKVQVEAVFQMMAQGRNDVGAYSVALAPDGKTLAAGSGNVIQLWEVETGKELRQIEGPSAGLAGLLFSPDSQTLAARATNGAIFLWAVDTGKEVRQIKPPPREQQNGIVLVFGGAESPSNAPGMAFTPDSKVLAAAAMDRKKEEEKHSVKFWDLATGNEIRKVETPQALGVSSVAIDPTGKVLAYGAGDAVHLCEVESGKELRQFKVGDGSVLALSFSADSKTLAVRGGNQRIRLWETETGKEIRQLAGAEPPEPAGGLAFILAGGFTSPEARTLAISPDGKQVAAAAGSTVRLWDLASGKELPPRAGHRKAPSEITLSTDGKVAVSWGSDHVIRRWDAATGQALGSFASPEGTTMASLSPDGQTVALANTDSSIRIHEAATGKEVHRLKGPEKGTAALAFAPGGKVLAARGRADNSIRLYDVMQGKELRQITLRPMNNGDEGRGVIVIGGRARSPRGPGLAFSPDCKLLVAPGPGGGNASNTLVFLDVATGKELRKIESSQAVRSIGFSPDGRVLATEHPDRTVTLWEVASAKQCGRLGKPAAEGQPANAGATRFTFVVDGMSFDSSDPAGPVGVTFSPDGRALAVRGPGRSVRVWDLTAAKEIGQLNGHEGRVETVAFAPNGKTLASGAADTTILVWDTAGLMKDLSKPSAVELAAQDLETLWRDLTAADAAKALRSGHKLAGDPKQAVPFLAERLKPAARVDPQKIDRLIADLDSEKFAVRKEAVSSLLKVGEQAVPALQKLLASSPPLETRKRVEELVDQLTGGTLTTEQLRVVRAVEALERIATPEARRLLGTLAEGAPGALPTREAQAALNRLAAPQP